MNWGKRIIIGMAAFMLFILALCVRMMSNQTDDYDHDYYEKGLTFDKDYHKEKQVTLDGAKPVISLNNKDVDIHFKNKAAGQLRFIRAADRQLDRSLKFESNKDGIYKSTINLPTKGKWQVVLDWESNGKKYLYTQDLWVR